MKQKIAAIGDIHGEVTKARKLVEKLLLKFGKETRLIFLGDYIDRGESSKDTLDYLISLKEDEKIDAIFLMGNHEVSLIEAVGEDEYSREESLFVADYYLEDFKDRDNVISVSDKHEAFLKSLKISHQEGDLLFVHGGITRSGEIDPWEYGVNGHLPEGVDLVVRGHVVHDEVTFYKDNICVDTGAWHEDGYLSAIVLPEREVVRVK